MKTMLNKVVAIGNMTVAHDITGIETLGVIIAGLSSGTACKVVTCDTADGVYTDFAELVPSTLASASYNSGFVLPLTGAKKFIKVTGASLAVGFIGDCNYDINKAVYNAVEIPSGADLENNKTATIDVSAYIEPVEIEPSAGKDGMKKTTVTLSNIPSGQVNVYCWGDNDFKFYTDFSSAPSSAPGDCSILMADDGLVKKTAWEDAGFDDYTYEKVDDSTIKMTLIDDPTDVLTFTRLSVNDFVLW